MLSLQGVHILQKLNLKIIWSRKRNLGKSSCKTTKERTMQFV